MPLDGLRAWIGEVERKLGMRTRVFLVLATIAIGGAGAAIYLAIDTREDAVSESDVRKLQERLEAEIAEDAATAPLPGTDSTAPPESPETTPQPETAPEDKPKSGSNPKPQSGAENPGETSGSDGTGATGSPGGEAAGKEKLQDLLDAAKKENAEAEK